ncbi:hypothetical protein uvFWCGRAMDCOMC455_09 [Freshwater phage uvFW-CGR-AMD-COM-C455]|nr:hypothetical protein uvFWCGRAMDCOMC455_09 [Freshwater phage uvFW-CGR-AMD-COM-C455]
MNEPESSSNNLKWSVSVTIYVWAENESEAHADTISMLERGGVDDYRIESLEGEDVNDGKYL